jgi:hypothetical protein
MQKMYQENSFRWIGLRVCGAMLVCAAMTSQAEALWLSYGPGSPVAVPAFWPAGSGLSGTASITASNFVNGNNITPLIGLTPLNVGPLLSPAYFAQGLTPNPVNIVPAIAEPYNDTGDKYHVEIDFAGTTGPNSTGMLPAGSTVAIIDLDITENFRKVRATGVSNTLITTPWLTGPSAYFDMNVPQTPPASLIPPPTLVGPVGGQYEMLGVSYNFDVGMWLFKTTQAIRKIEFDMEVGVGGNSIGGGGGGWAFYEAVPEPTLATLVAMLLAASGMCHGGRVRRP